MSVLPAALLAWMVLCPAQASAAEVFINGVQVTGRVRNQSFERVGVSFDKDGNVHVQAPGYKIELPAAPSASPAAGVAAAPGKPAGRYWAVITVPAPGHYQLEVTVNGQRIAQVPASSRQYVAELTQHVRFGINNVLITFLPTASPPVTPPVKAVDVLVGSGKQGADGTLQITRVYGKLKQQSGQHAAVARPISFKLAR